MDTEEKQSSQSESQQNMTNEGTQEQKEKLRETLEETRRRVDESFRNLQAQTGPTTQTARRWVRENPIAAFLGATGVGLLLGRIFSSRRERVDSSMPLSERIEARAREIARQRAKEGRRTPEDRLKEAGTQAQAATRTVREEGQKRLSKTKDTVSDKMSGALSKAALAIAAKKLNDWVKRR